MTLLTYLLELIFFVTGLTRAQPDTIKLTIGPSSVWNIDQPILKSSKQPSKDSTTAILSSSSPSLQLNMVAKRGSAQLMKLGWDTERTDRDTINLLKSPVELCLSKGNRTLVPMVTSEMVDNQTIRYQFVLPDHKQLFWKIAVKAGEMSMQLLSNEDITSEVDRIELLFPFNPRKTVTSIIGSNWTQDNKFRLPVILSAPDIGQLLLSSPDNLEIRGITEGSRSEGWVLVKIELPVPDKKSTTNLKFTPVVLPIPKGYTDLKRWEEARRGWFNLIQQSCGASGGGKNVAGIWANNVLSDPVSSLLYMLGDATLLVPELAKGVTMPPILRRTVEYWIDHKTSNYGLVCYFANGTWPAEGKGGDALPNEVVGDFTQRLNVMDGNPAVIIGAWSYVKASSDTGWLKNRIKNLEFIAQYMENRDIDGDGLIESRQSGNAGSRPPWNPDMAWDIYASGHKNAYVNVLAYRAFNDLADLEKQLDKKKQEKKYRQEAEKLKSVFLKTFYNQETGWLGWWRSKDRKLHDIYSDLPTSFAITSGIISSEEGKKMLQRYWKVLESTGFNRFDLGVPICLRPIPHEEMDLYFQTDKYQEFHKYLNGGCCVSNTAFLIDALYLVGMTQQADMILDAMLKRQNDGVFPNGGGFQNGFSYRGVFDGAEFFDWEGGVTGYEGHLVYSWAFLHSMLRKDPLFRK